MAAMSSYMPLIQAGASIASQAMSQSAQNNQSQQTRERQLELMRQQNEAENRRRLNLLEENQASARAAMGAMGVGGGGSGDALMKGLFKKSAQSLSDMNSDYANRRAELEWRSQVQDSNADSAQMQSGLGAGLNFMKMFGNQFGGGGGGGD